MTPAGSVAEEPEETHSLICHRYRIPGYLSIPGNSIDLGEITVNSGYPDTESTGEDPLYTDEPYLHTAHAGLAISMYPQQNTLKFILDMRNISAIVTPIKPIYYWH